MKTRVFAATAVLSLAAITSAPATAQTASGANAPKVGIAVVDVSKIFKKHNGFLAAMNGMKGEMQGIEQQLEGDRQKIIAKEGEMKSFKPGSAERSNAEDQLASMKAGFQLRMQKLRKDFLEKEGRFYYNTYQQVSQAIEYYATQNNIVLVMRFNAESADPAQRDSILRDINKPVQFQNQLDITDNILALLNRNTQAAPTVGARPGARPAR